VAAEIAATYCLGLEFLGECKYAFDPPTAIYFTIGDAVTVIALIVALFQLSRPIVRFRLRVRRVGFIAAILFFLIGLAAVFVAALIPQTPFKGMPLIGYPITWEVVAGLLLVIGSFTVLAQTQSRAKISRLSKKTYYDFCVTFIARGESAHLQEFVDELRISIPRLVAWANGVRPRWRDHSRRRSRPQIDPIERPLTQEYAISIFALLSDAMVARLLVIRCPGTLYTLLAEIQRERMYDVGRPLVQKIVEFAITDHDSVLHREKEYSGLGFRRDFTNLLFGNVEFANSRLSPFSGWHYWEREAIHPREVEKFGEGVVALIRAHLNERWTGIAYGLNQGLQALNSVASFQTAAINALSDAEYYESNPFRIVRAVERTWDEIIGILGDQSVRLDYAPFDPASYTKRTDDRSLQGYLAHALYRFFEVVSGIHAGRARSLVIDLWLRIFSDRLEIAHNVWEIQVRVRALLMEKARQNFTQQSYPAVARLLMAIFGIPGERRSSDSTESLFARQFFDFVADNFEDAWRRNRNRAEDMLSDTIRFDPHRRVLYQTWEWDGHETTLDVSRPKPSPLLRMAHE
jgi:hypothetical protein